MSKDLEFIVKKVLISETNTFLTELDSLMEKIPVTKQKPGRTQFKTVMDAAGKASSVEELLLFISYQAAKKNSDGWGIKCRNGNSIADNVVESLHHMIEIVEDKIMQSIKVQQLDSEDERKIRLRIAEKYLGYLYWKITILKGQVN